MKKMIKRILSFTLALAMVLSVIPAMEIHTHAATTKDFSGSTVAGLGMSATNANGSGTGDNAPVCTWNASSNTISGSLVGGKDPVGPQTYYYASSTTLTLTNNLTKEAELSFTYSATTSGSAYGDITVNGTKHTSSVSNQFVSEKLASGSSITITLHVPERKKFSFTGALPDPNGASITITGIQLVEDNSVTVNFGTATNGSYTVAKADGTVVDTSAALSAQATDKFTLTATPNEGYAFAGWYFTPEGGTETIWSGAAIYSNAMFLQNGTLTAKFEDASLGVWQVGDAKFSDLAVALSAAQSDSSHTVVPLNDEVTISGNYVIPAGVTLLIPCDGNNTPCTNAPNIYSGSATTPPTPTVFKKLVMAEGAKITVYGNICVEGTQAPSQGYNGCPTGATGFIQMASGSEIVLESGSNLYAWGYITGVGTITAKSGSSVYECFQLTDFRGGSCLIVGEDSYNVMSGKGMIYDPQGKRVFPMSQYYIQNIEVLLTLNSGATEHAYMCTNAGGLVSTEIAGTLIPIISNSNSSMFQLTAGTISKDFNESTGRLDFVVNGTLTVNSITMTLQLMGMAQTVSSADFVLPIPGHMSVVATGNSSVVINQDMALLPGAQFAIGSNVDCTLGSGYKIIVYDAGDWAGYVGWLNAPFRPLPYAPGKTATTIGTYTDVQNGSTVTLSGVAVEGLSTSGCADAKVIVDGYIDASAGAVYTTNGGADITGTGVIKTTPGSDTETYQAIQRSKTPEYVSISVKPAVLKNGNAAHPETETSGVDAGTTFYYNSDCNMWVTHGATGHKEETIAGKAATCTETGLTEGKHCSVCGEVLVAQETVAALGHSYDNDCDADCNVCGATRTPADHVYGTEWKTDETNHWHECACGAKSEEAAHSDETTKDHKCDTCGYVMSECADSDDADHKCDHCGQDDVTDHTWVEADCDTPKTCSVCGETEGEALGHTHQSYGYDDDQHWSICGVCGETFDKAAHTFGDDHKCDCGAQNFWVDCSENIQYSIYKGTVTVTHGFACKAGYLDGGKYVEIPAVKNDNGYSFSAPEGVTSIVIVVIGDVDGNGLLEMADKTLLDAYLADPENAPLNEIHKFAADVNGNGAINSADKILLARALMSGNEAIYKPFAWNTGEGA